LIYESEPGRILHFGSTEKWVRNQTPEVTIPQAR
jgi:hypothetical protein